MKVRTQVSEDYTAASNCATTSAALWRLVFHADEKIRAMSAENENISLACLKVLAGDTSHEVRIAVVLNPRTPKSILLALVDDDHPDVRYAMAENANLPSRFLAILAADTNPFVAERAKKTLERAQKNLNAQAISA
jgi:hypothetical protein